jgi:hypothetical protein
MRRNLLIFGLVFGVLGAQPPNASAQKKKDNIEQATYEEYVNLNSVKEVTGIVSRVEPNDVQTSSTLVVRIPYQTLDPKNAQALSNQNAQMQRLLVQQQTALAIKDATKQLRKVQQLQDQINRLQQKSLANLKVIQHYKEFELQPADKLEIRWQKPKTEFDDQGNVKEYTKEELRKMKGDDPNKVGYAGAFLDLASGQYVKVKLVPAKKTLTTKDSSGSELPPDPLAERPHISFVLILAEANNPVDDSAGKKTKKN